MKFERSQKVDSAIPASSVRGEGGTEGVRIKGEKGNNGDGLGGNRDGRKKR